MRAFQQRSCSLATLLVYGMAISVLLPLNVAGQSAGGSAPRASSQAQGMPSASLSGRVVNASTGEGLPKVELRLMAARSPSQPSSGASMARTSADGAFHLEGLSGGQYMLTVTRRAFAAGAGEVRGFASIRKMGFGWLVTLAEGQAVRNVEIRLPPAAVVTGQVLDEEGEPMMGVVVEAEQYRYLQGVRTLAPTGRATSDDRGIYRIYDLAPGRYFIKTRNSAQHARLGGLFVPGAPAASSASPGAPSSRAGRGRVFGGGAASNAEESFSYPDTYYPRAHSASEAIPLQLSPGAEMGGIDFSLSPSPTYSISGTVSGIEAPPAAGELPRSNVFVTALPAGQFAFGAPSAMAPVNPVTGEFTIRGLAPGNYQVIARLNGRGRENANSIGVAQVTVANSSVAGVGISILGDVTVAGRVVLPEGFPNASPGRIVITPVRRISPARSSARADADGAFEIALPRVEPLRFDIAGIPEGMYVKRITVGSVDLLHSPAYTLPANPGRVVVELAADGAGLRGALRDSRGAPAANARLSLLPVSSFGAEQTAADSLWRRTVLTAEDGSFNISGIAPGRYRLFAFESLDADPAVDAAFLSNFGQRWKELDLKPKENASPEISPIPASESAMYLDEAQ